jgi:dihydrofolate reductase
MRPVVYSLTASLDGYINRTDGTLDWISTDLGVPPDQFFREKFSTFDAVIIGRKSYDTMRAMPGGGAYPGLKNYVVSSTIQAGERDGFEFISGDLKGWVEKLKNAPGKKIWLSGGELARSFLEAGLVDEIEIAVQPVLLGKGVPLFPGPFPESKLKLERADRLGSAIVEIVYSVQR